MFDPSLGRWITEDPTEFDAGDPNFYRFVGNNPATLSDPSGLKPEPPINIGFPPGAQLPWKPPSNAREIGGMFKCKVDCSQAGFKEKEYDEIMEAMFKAAERVYRAWYVVTYQWDKLKRTIVIDDGDGLPTMIPSPRFRQLEKYRSLYIDRLNTAYNALRIGNQRHIRLVRTNETHPEGNPLYTEEWRAIWIDWSARAICARTHFWDLSLEKRAYWLAHEYARFFLQLDDDKDYEDGQGVEQWDDMLDWLNQEFLRINHQK